MNQYVNVSLSLLGLCGIVGAGVAIGSGVGMMALNVAQDQQEEGKQENVAVVAAHSPVETKGSFAARGVSGAEH
ncbi:hypothetical protein M9434_003815 [Picochlorum sp. BPE23]|jgi:hypothetical protein|nr:hypothetical protein M9434_003815 [Picochlorum sp. BPE23]KAI8113388.1 hypothetical protein M9435_003392 [Picochlorum sp. BPE23]